MDVKTSIICQIPELKLSCWGCCGRNFGSKVEIEQQIKINTFEFKQIKVPSSVKLLIFRDRFDKDPFAVSGSGICTNLVKFENGMYACPLHENINDIVDTKEFLKISKKDLRWGHCDVNCLCESVILFKMFSDEQKKEYFAWISKQNFNHYTYSMGNINGYWIRKFLDERNQILD